MANDTVPQDQKAKSPSPNIQRAVDQAWQSRTGTTDPKQALSQKWTNNPVKP